MTKPDVDYTDAKLDELSFDPSNPRFGRLKGNPSQDEIQAMLEREPHLALELVDSFLANGFIRYEPLVVRHRTGGGYVVVEGNRRLAALRHIAANRSKYEKLSSKERVDSLAENIPILVFPQGADDEQRVYLGVREI